MCHYSSRAEVPRKENITDRRNANRSEYKNGSVKTKARKDIHGLEYDVQYVQQLESPIEFN